MNCQFQHAGCDGSLSETVSVADHDSNSCDARHLGYDWRCSGNVVQQPNDMTTSKLPSWNGRSSPLASCMTSQAFGLARGAF